MGGEFCSPKRTVSFSSAHRMFSLTQAIRQIYLSIIAVHLFDEAEICKGDERNVSWNGCTFIQRGVWQATSEGTWPREG